MNALLLACVTLLIGVAATGAMLPAAGRAARGNGHHKAPPRLPRISRRREQAAGGARHRPRTRVAAPEAPAPAPIAPGAGASPALPRPGDPPRGAARSGPGQQPLLHPLAGPGLGQLAEVPWVQWHGQPGAPVPRPRRQLPDGHVAVWHDDEQRYRIHSADTAPLPAVRYGIYAARQREWDKAVNEP